MVTTPAGILNNRSPLSSRGLRKRTSEPLLWLIDKGGGTDEGRRCRECAGFEAGYRRKSLELKEKGLSVAIYFDSDQEEETKEGCSPVHQSYSPEIGKRPPEKWGTALRVFWCSRSQEIHSEDVRG